MRAVIVLSFLTALALAAPVAVPQSEIIESKESRTTTIDGETSGSFRNFRSEDGEIVTDEQGSFGEPSSTDDQSNRDRENSVQSSDSRPIVGEDGSITAGGIKIDREGKITFN